MSLIPKMPTKRKCSAVDVKEVIKKHKNRAQITNIAAQFKLPKSMVATIFKEQKYCRSRCCKRSKYSLKNIKKHGRDGEIIVCMDSSKTTYW